MINVCLSKYLPTFRTINLPTNQQPTITNQPTYLPPSPCPTHLPTDRATYLPTYQPTTDRQTDLLPT